MRVEKRLAKKTPEEEGEIRVSGGSTVDQWVDRKGKQENKKFVPRVFGGKKTKSSSGKQKKEVGRFGGMVWAEQPGESTAGVNKRPWCLECKWYHTEQCFRDANVCYNCAEVGHYKRKCPQLGQENRSRNQA